MTHPNTEQPADTSPIGDVPEYLVDLIDDHFPKGQSKERGNANVVLAYFLMWHQSQTTALLKRVRDEVIGEDVTRNFDKEYGYCDTCDFEPTDDTDHCICYYNNNLRAEQRKAIDSLEKELMG